MSEALFIDTTKYPCDTIDLVETISQFSLRNINDVISLQFVKVIH